MKKDNNIKEKSRGFFYEAHCENGSPSSKRLWGAVGFTTVQICLISATILSLYETGELSSGILSLLDFDLVTSASLIGLTTISRMFGGNRTNIGNKKENETEE